MSITCQYLKGPGKEKQNKNLRCLVVLWSHKFCVSYHILFVAPLIILQPKELCRSFVRDEHSGEETQTQSELR